MLQRLRYYKQKLSEVQAKIQDKLDNTDESKEELYAQREEQIDALEEIIGILDDLISSIEDYNDQWNGLKSIK